MREKLKDTDWRDRAIFIIAMVSVIVATSYFMVRAHVQKQNDCEAIGGKYVFNRKVWQGKHYVDEYICLAPEKHK